MFGSASPNFRSPARSHSRRRWARRDHAPRCRCRRSPPLARCSPRARSARLASLRLPSARSRASPASERRSIGPSRSEPAHRSTSRGGTSAGGSLAHNASPPLRSCLQAAPSTRRQRTRVPRDAGSIVFSALRRQLGAIGFVGAEARRDPRQGQRDRADGARRACISEWATRRRSIVSSSILNHAGRPGPLPRLTGSSTPAFIQKRTMPGLTPTRAATA